MSHLQYEWESPVWRHWIDSLSKGNTLIRYDERGNGLSDWNASDLSFAAMVCDLESVADANSLSGFPLLGVSQSCAVSVAYAVRHPERVSHLVLYGGYAKGWRKRGDRHEIDTHEAMTTLIREGWGKDNPAFRQLFTETFIPGASREQMAWFNDLQKETASPDNASRLHYSFGDMDVSDILGDVSVPTLVLHARNDAAVPFEQGKALAAGIPGARFVDLNSANHIILRDEPAFADFLRKVSSFISVAGPD
jgi:pimeloyl-ACP methyl ester carboxylesterase